MSVMEKEEWEVVMKHYHRSVGQLRRWKREREAKLVRIKEIDQK